MIPVLILPRSGPSDGVESHWFATGRLLERVEKKSGLGLVDLVVQSSWLCVTSVTS